MSKKNAGKTCDSQWHLSIIHIKFINSKEIVILPGKTWEKGSAREHCHARLCISGILEPLGDVPVGLAGRTGPSLIWDLGS